VDAQERYKRAPCTDSMYAAFFGLCTLDPYGSTLDTEPFGPPSEEDGSPIWKYDPLLKGHPVFLDSYRGADNVEIVKELRTNVSLGWGVGGWGEGCRVQGLGIRVCGLGFSSSRSCGAM